MSIPATVEIITRDSAATLRRALESVKDFAEIIVVDGHSTDTTLSIAHEYGATIIAQDKQFLDPQGAIIDFAGVRNQGLARASQAWFFFLDSDEEASGQLVSRLRNIIGQEEQGAYWIQRQYVYQESPVACSASYPNRQVRFFHRESVGLFRKTIHERIVIPDSTPIFHINEPILVPVTPEAAAAHAKMKRYAELEMERLAALGEKALISGMLRALRSVASFSFNLIRSRVLCFGTHLPLFIEIRTITYQAMLFMYLFKRYFKK